MNDGPYQWDGEFRPLVAFDFDGTLTHRDSLLAFLAWRAGAAGYCLRMAGLGPAVLAWLGDRDRTKLKVALLRKFMAGAPCAQIAEEAQAFAATHARALLRPDALRRWRRWQAAGARVIIVTASPELIVAPFAHGLGADALIGTRLAVDGENRLTGGLVGPNCRGPEKVARIVARFGPNIRLEAAYGDSDGDREMLALADEAGLKVFGEKP